MAFTLGSIPASAGSIAMPAGVVLRCRPLTTPIWYAAQAFASRAILAVAAGEELREEIGLGTDDLPDLGDADARAGLQKLLFVQALARAAIVSWQGVLDETGAPAPVTRETVNIYMLSHRAADEFIILYGGRVMEAQAEGNASRPGANGTSTPGLTTAGPANRKTRRAAVAGAAKTANAAPMSSTPRKPRRARRSGH